MSRKQDRTNQPKVFISFGDVAGGFRPSQAETYDEKRSSAPMYTGSDHELAVIAKKLLKRDHTTKLKAVQDLPHALKGKSEHVVAEFLTYFVYCFPRLCLDDSRAIRQQLTWAIDAVVSVEKRLLAPHMNSLIGPWWMLTGDPAPEVAESALSAFNTAIPPKKRQPVLAHLAPHILKESEKNLRCRRETLCDMSVTTAAEADERLERVLISTFAAVGKLMTTLTEEQNQQLCDAPAASGDRDAALPTYAGFVTGNMWTTGFKSEFANVRKATYLFVSAVAAYVPRLLCEECTHDEGAASVRAFTELLLSAVRTEKHVPNLVVLLDALIAVARHVKGFFRRVSIGEEIIPLAEYLVQAHPQLAIEYLLPLIGSLPPVHVSLLEAGCKPAGGSIAAGVEASHHGLVNLLVCLTDFAEAKAIEATEDKSSDAVSASYDAAAGSAGRPRSARNRRLIAARRVSQLRGLQAESASLGVKADVCVVELATLMLLRRTDKHSADAPQNHAEVAVPPHVNSVIDMIIQSIVLTAQAAAEHASGSTQRSGKFLKALQSGASAPVGETHSVLTAATAASMQSIARSLQQVQRATLLGLHLSSAQWTSLFWTPLASAVSDLGAATADLTVEPTADGDVTAGADSAHTTLLNVMRLTETLLDAVAPAWQEKAPQGGEVVAHTGVEVLVDTMREALASLLAASADSDEDMAASYAALHTTAAQALIAIAAAAKRIDPKTNLIARTLEAVTGEWLVTAVRAASTGEHEGLGGIIMCGVSELSAFVANAARSDVSFRTYEQRLLSACIAADSAEAVSVLLVRNGQIVWPEGQQEWARSKGAEILSSPSAGKTQLQFLLLLASNASLAQLTLALVAAIASQSNRVVADRTARSFILTLMAAALKTGTLPASVQEGVLSWLKDHEDLVHSALTRLFFARIRTRENTWRSTQRSAHSSRQQAMAQSDAPLENVKVVCDWADVQKVLLPLLPKAAGEKLCEEIAATLNAAVAASTAVLTAASTEGPAQRSALRGDGIASVAVEAASEGEDDDEDASAAISTDVATAKGSHPGLQPQKWARHALGLLSLAQSISAQSTADGTARNHVLDVARPGYWREYFLRVDSCSPARLEYMQALFSVTGSAPGAVFHPNLEVVLWVLCSVFALTSQSGKPAFEALRASCLQAFAAASLSQRRTFFEHALRQLMGDVEATTGGAAEHVRNCLRTLLQAELAVPGGSSDVEQIKYALRTPIRLLRLPGGNNMVVYVCRLQSPSLHRAERPERGAPGVYLHWKTRSASQTSPTAHPGGYEGLTSITAVPCKLAEVHREAGADPYFTVGIDRTGDSTMAHELQVEWPK
jgi:hypothetical protein